MARKKTSDGDNLKILDLPKRKPKFITSDEWAEISQLIFLTTRLMIFSPLKKCTTLKEKFLPRC